MSEFDVLIENARIVDGSEKAPYTGSIGVKGDAVRTVDAKGLYASPGFIDAHSHGDGSILFYPLCNNYVMQGVTTFVGGQCGGFPAPVGR
jgi:N-acyl-D-aspartate/D-glutamate deacylase